MWKNEYDGAIGLSVICLVVIAISSLGLLFTAREMVKRLETHIVITKETVVSNFEGGKSLIVDYTVNGIATHAIYRESELHLYPRLISNLKEVGRLKYALEEGGAPWPHLQLPSKFPESP